MMSDDQILEVVQAHKEGKQIQSRLKDECYSELAWLPLPVGTTVFWNFSKTDYRVAPEPLKPREWYLVSDDSLIKSALPVTDVNRGQINGVLVREVLDDAV